MVKTFTEVMSFTRNVSSAPAFGEEECFALYDQLIRIPAGAVVCEIGCQLGRTSSIILQLAKDLGFRSLHIDPWTNQPDFLAQWTSMAHSLDVSYTLFKMRADQAVRLPFFPERIELLLIDGDHTYAGVKADTEIADRARVMCAHDYGRGSLIEVTQAIDEYVAKVEKQWRIAGVYGTLGVWYRG